MARFCRFLSEREFSFVKRRDGVAAPSFARCDDERRNPDERSYNQAPVNRKSHHFAENEKQVGSTLDDEVRLVRIAAAALRLRSAPLAYCADVQPLAREFTCAVSGTHSTSGGKNWEICAVRLARKLHHLTA